MADSMSWVRKGDTLLIKGQFTQKGSAGDGVYIVTGVGVEETKKNVSEVFEYRVGDILVHKFGAKYQVLAIDVYTPSKKPFSFRLKNLSNGCTDSPQWVGREVVYKDYEPDNQMHKLLYGKK